MQRSYPKRRCVRWLLRIRPNSRLRPRLLQLCHRHVFMRRGRLCLDTWAYMEVSTIDGLLPIPHKLINNLHWAGTETAQEHPGYL